MARCSFGSGFFMQKNRGDVFYFGKPKKPWPWKSFTKKIFILNVFFCKNYCFSKGLFHQQFQGTTGMSMVLSNWDITPL